MLEREQGVIENDVRNRWRTVRDRFRKQVSKTPASGSSPSRGRGIAYYEELAFLIPCRELRRTSGNVPPRTPQGSARGQVQQQAVAGSSSIVAEEDAPYQPTPAPATPRGDTSPAPTAGTSLPRQRVGGRKRQTPADQSDTVEGQAMRMIRRVEAEDQYTSFGNAVGGRCREMENTRRAAYMTCVFALADIFEAPQPLPDVGDLIFHMRTLTGRRADTSGAVPHAPPPASAPSLQPDPYFSPWTHGHPSGSTFRPYPNVPNPLPTPYSSTLPPLHIHPPTSAAYMPPTSTSSSAPSSHPQLSPPRFHIL
ncbi:uncharacterized protein LOC142660326 [Rhinoderma darwinii]|uniref:uncharacterized protein LOC142660326 n=1 Tax=Rhinoderma darwinii TaxID=43563 RepID=UPI003F67F098